MARRKHQEGKAVEAGQRHNEQMARATLGRLYEMTFVHYLLVKVMEGQKVLDGGKENVPKEYIRKQRRDFPKSGRFPGITESAAADMFLWENGESKVRRGLRDIFPQVESAIRKGDSDEFRRIADVIDLIKNEGAKSPLLAIISTFKWERENGSFYGESFPDEPWPWTTSRLRDWIRAETGKEYPTNKIRSAAEQVGVPLADGRGKGKKTVSRK
jgi:hypothetical protein